MANMWQISAQCSVNLLSLLPQYMPTVFFGSLSHRSSLPTAACGSHDHKKLFVLHVFLVFIVLFQITKAGNIEINLILYRQKFLVDILDNKNIFTWKVKTRRCYNMKISRSTVSSFIHADNLVVLAHITQESFSIRNPNHQHFNHIWDMY